MEAEVAAAASKNGAQSTKAADTPQVEVKAVGQDTKEGHQQRKSSQAKSPLKDHVMFDKVDKNSWAKGIAKLMEGRKVSGCMGCLHRSHVFNYSFKGCPKSCPFCHKPFRDRDAHVAIKCPKLPAGGVMFSILAKAK